MKAIVRYAGGLRFVGEADSGHSVAMDGPPGAGGSDTAPRPSELLLLGLAGCTAMDVLSILRKKRQPVENLEVAVEGDQGKEHPRRFTALQVTYIAYGEGIDPEALRRAVELSEKKYCSVGATLSEVTYITSTYEIRPPK